MNQKIADDSVESIKCDINNNEHNNSSPTSGNGDSSVVIKSSSECRPEIEYPSQAHVFECDTSEDVKLSAKLRKLRSAQYSYTCCLCDDNIEKNYIKKLTANSKMCGKYCKFLNATQQYKAIFKCRGYLITSRKKSVEQLYIVPAEWWRQWCDFVNVEYNTYANELKISHQKQIQNDNLIKDKTKPTHKREPNICNQNTNVLSQIMDKAYKEDSIMDDSMFVTDNFSIELASPKVSNLSNVKPQDIMGKILY